jgi:hypothetical protein
MSVGRRSKTLLSYLKKSFQLSAILFLSLPAFSQANTGRIIGEISDQSGGVIAGATVTVIDVARGISRSLITDGAGEYAAPNLTPGTYTVRAEAKGFRTIERQNIILEVGGEVRIDLILQPGEQTQTVTVSSDVPQVETTNAELGGTLQNVIINALPLNGRNFENLLSLRPGVLVYPGGGGWDQSTNGQRFHDNVYLIDGVNANDPYMGMSVMNNGMVSGDAGTILPIDAIDEFKTGENPKAEYGWKPGAIVNVGIKSGTNALHGTAYAFGRTAAWDARDYFNPPPQLVSPLSFQQFGATLGGPIKKDKLFYFLTYEDQRYSVGNPSVHDGIPITGGPGATGPNGLIGACLNALTNGGVSSLSAQLVGLSPTCVPLANYPGLFPVNTTGGNTISTDLNTTNQIDAGLVKVNYHINEKNTLTGTYFISPGNGLVVTNPNGILNPSQFTIQYARAQTGAGNWTWTPNSTWVNEFRVGYSHYYENFLSNDHTADPANYTFNGSIYHLYTGQTNPLYFGFPGISFASTPTLALGGGWPKIVGPDAGLEFADHVSVLRGNHAFKFGVEIMKNSSTNDVTQNAKGPLRFAGPPGGTVSADFQSFFNGIPSRANFLTGNLLRHMSSPAYASFLQDDWRVTPRLTVNLGLRYEYDGVLKEKNGLLGNFDPNSPTGMVQINGGAYNPDYHNFAPRLGLAWDVSGNGKTVVRAGASLMYEQFSYDVFNLGNLQGLRMVPTGAVLYANGAQVQNTGTINVTNITFVGPAVKGTTTPGQIAYDWINNSPNQPLYSASPSCGDGTVTLATGLIPQPCSIVGVDRNLYSPYVTTWTLDIQHALTNTLSLEIGYVGNHGTGFIGIQDVNEAPLGAGYCMNSPLTAGQIAAGCTGPDINFPNTSAAEQGARPYFSKFPYLQYIDKISNSNKSNYNGLQAALTQRTSHGLSYTAGYTYSHALDDSSDNSSCCIPIYPNQNLLYGNGLSDIRHRFTLSLTYDLPGKKGFGQMLEGWSINSIITLQTGLPWGVNDYSNDFSGTGEVNQPAQGQGEQWNFYGNPADFNFQHGWTDTNGGALSGGNGGVPFYSGSGDPGAPTTNAACNSRAATLGANALAALASTGCYAAGSSVMIPPPYGSFGTMGKNIFRDGGFQNVDFSIFKSFKFRERLTAQFRVELFNVFNRPEFSNPAGTSVSNGFTDPSAASFGCGCVTPDVGASDPVMGSGGPRVMQLGLKLIF